ncbi:MAG TPA: 6,7-dimethyl-8-ribityllumazine synthase [Verrucomicrobiae bacterium]|nr:6,7-dimethyl-8-ribityllumazine synthase [Verrucomicrobiae bacterium]
MLRARKIERPHSAVGLRFGIAAARYNVELADSLLANCLDTLAKAGADIRDIKVLRVPGTFEVSAAAAKLARSGQCDCVIGLGVLLQGETRHAQHIGDAVAHGLTHISILMGVPTVFGIVTAGTVKQARVRCVGKQHNRGHEAALTAIEMARAWNDR